MNRRSQAVHWQFIQKQPYKIISKLLDVGWER